MECHCSRSVWGFPLQLKFSETLSTVVPRGGSPKWLQSKQIDKIIHQGGHARVRTTWLARSQKSHQITKWQVTWLVGISWLPSFASRVNGNSMPGWQDRGYVRSQIHELSIFLTEKASQSNLSLCVLPLSFLPWELTCVADNTKGDVSGTASGAI